MSGGEIAYKKFFLALSGKKNRKIGKNRGKKKKKQLKFPQNNINNHIFIIQCYTVSKNSI